MAGLGRALGPLTILILGSGYDSDSAGGPVAGGSRGPWVAPFVVVGWLCAGQGAWGRALRRVQAVVITVAQGQVREIFSRRRRPLWVSRAAACRIL